MSYENIDLEKAKNLLKNGKILFNDKNLLKFFEINERQTKENKNQKKQKIKHFFQKKLNFLKNLKRNKKKVKKLIFCLCNKTIEKNYCETISRIIILINNKNLKSPKILKEKKLKTINKILNLKFNQKKRSQSITKKKQNKLKRSNSQKPENRQNSFAILQSINMDIKRTFQNISFFKKKDNKNLFQSILITLYKNHNIEYIQGMNYWVGSIIYHSINFNVSLKISKFLYEKLELIKIYNFDELDNFIYVLFLLIKLHLKNLVYIFGINENMVKLVCLDFFFCLGFDKIQIESSGKHLEFLICFGWFYFFRFIINFFKFFEKSVFYKIKKNSGFFVMKVKSFLKSNIDWNQIIKNSINSPLNDKIIEISLKWNYIDIFNKPGFIL